MDRVQLIGFSQSTYVRVCRIVALEKGIDHEHVSVPPHSEAVDAIHPYGKVPVMRHGSLALCESRAIVGYLDRVFPGPKMIPEDPAAAAKVEQWVSLGNTAFDPVLIRRYLLAYIFPKGPDGQPDRAAIDAVLPQVAKALDIMAAGVAENGHFVGDELTYADINVLPMLFYLRKTPEAGEHIAKSGALTAFLARHEGRPSVVETTPGPM